MLAWGREAELIAASHRGPVTGHRGDARRPLVVDGERRWVTWEQLDHDDGGFPELGAAFEAEHRDLVGRQPASTSCRR